jgi:hypothetical protein
MRLVDKLFNTISIPAHDIGRHSAALHGGRGLDISLAVSAYQTALPTLKAKGRLTAVSLLYKPLPLVPPQLAGQATYYVCILLLYPHI